MEMLSNVGSVLLLVLGFGFVIFWHELGHFLAAKAVGIKVEQFAVGFGQAMLCWRKGLGFTVGTSAQTAEDLRKAGRTDISETEYRLNWIPLGGYVKMLGQDDMDPNATSADPRAFNNKSVGARMLVVSAGVIMNVLLAAVMFMGLFMVGHNVPAALVGSVTPGSPAQQAGIEVGDRIVSVDGAHIPDFTKIQLNVALGHEGHAIPIVVERDGKPLTLEVTPRKPRGKAEEFLMLGVSPTPALRGLPVGTSAIVEKPEQHVLPDQLLLEPGDVITAIAGQPITPESAGSNTPSQYARLYQSLQASDGKTVPVTVRGTGGEERTVAVRPWMVGRFGGEEFHLAGVFPRPVVGGIQVGSDAAGKLRPGDIVLSVQFDDTRDLVLVESAGALREALTTAGKEGRKVTLTVLRDGQEVQVAGLLPNLPVGDGKRGLGIAIQSDTHSNVVAGVRNDSPAELAGIKPGSRIVAVNGEPVANLFEFRRKALGSVGPEVEITTESDGVQSQHRLPLSDADRSLLASYRSEHLLPLDERIEPRQTSNPLTAAAWGIGDTRDFILQGYITIKRIFQGSVSATNLTGPIGIFHFGGKIATEKPLDWMIWFLAMISANLAVVNFLPIPIVDGGLFLFLILEKIRGKPLSPRAQGIAQLVGLAIILSVFVFVTYNDIARLLT